jgi:pimeloyl-ACP methyl ester carboxylesterase
LTTTFLLLLFLVPWSSAAQTQSPASRPVLFVHGICGDSASWQALRSDLSSRLNSDSSSLYPDSTAYDVFFDGTSVVFDLNGIRVDEAAIPSSTRFFTMRFYDPNGGGLDPAKVAQVSILNKANELATVIKEITRVTEVKDVILLAYSMGGLVARAYLENMASALNCYRYNGGVGGSPDYFNGFCRPGGCPYQGDVAQLITIDTPHGGSELAGINDPFATFDGLFPCVGGQSTTKTEMKPGSELLQNLNYFSSSIASAEAIPSQVQVQSIESYFSDGTPAWGLIVGINNDTVIGFDNQSMQTSLSPSAKNGLQFGDWGNPYTVETITPQPACQANVSGLGTVAAVLHYIQCVGQQVNTQALVHSIVKPIINGTLDRITVQATLDTGSGPLPWTGAVEYHLEPGGIISGLTPPSPGNSVPSVFTGTPVGSYQVVYDSGGPQGTNVQATVSPVITILDSTNWNPTFTISFVQSVSSTPGLSSVTINPSALSSGNSATVSATLNTPAPAGGAQILLSSSNPTVFPVPPSVTIPLGQTSGTSAGIITGAVASPTTVNVMATYGSSSRVAPLVVNPGSTSSVSITLTASQTDINVGQSVSLTAILGGAKSGTPPTGQLHFYDTFNGVATQLGSGGFTPAGSGQYLASLSAGALLAGQHSVTAIYDGDSTYGSAISNVVSIAVQQQSQGSQVLSGLTITPSTIVGGLSPQGVVTLTGNAPAGGATVVLTSNNAHFVQVPPTVTVTPGFSNVAFPITTSFTGGTAGATITASYNRTTYGASVTVVPVAITGVTFAPGSVTAGSSALFTIYLNGPAGPGTSISLTSSNPGVLQVPSTVPLATGATQATMSGQTFAAGSQTVVSVVANYNSSSGSGSLTVVPSPPLTLNSFNFSPATITGGTSASATIWLTGNAPGGGASVSVTSTSGLVQSPGVVTVAGGSAFTTVSIPTSAVSVVTNVSLTASYGGVSQNATLTLVPPLPYLASLGFSPSTVSSGSAATGTITLTAPAPLGGILVNLASNSVPTILRVPFSVFIPEGATTGTFNANSSAIHFIAPVTITASFNGTSQSATLTIVPPGMPIGPSSLTLSPSSVVGGTSSTGTLVLTGPAPPGGLTITLSSDNSGVQVPPSITVPEGANSTIFSIGTSAVSAISTATIAALGNGVSQSALLTLKPSTPAPAIMLPLLVPPTQPVSQVPASSGLGLTVEGTGFLSGAQLSWNGTSVPTTFVSGSELQASIPGASTQRNGSASIWVTNPGSSAPSNFLPVHLSFPVAAPSFAGSSLSLTGQPATAVTADFNRDGKVDLVVGKSDGSGLSVFLGNGDGTFGPELLLPVTGSLTLVVGDFNGDGKQDLAAVSSVGGTISIFLGNGDGTFTAASRVVVPAAATNPSLAVGDFNGDGNLDVALAGAQGVYVLLGNGDGTFGAAVDYGTVSFPSSLATADFNGDGKLDLVAADSANQSVAVLLGNGDGTFQPQQEFSTAGNAFVLCVADFNADGHPDIAVANQGPHGSAGAGIGILLGKGDGTFLPVKTYAAGENFYFVTTDDVNGDGKLDLLAVPNPADASTDLLFLGNGDGTFAASPIGVGSALPAGMPLAIADLNNDGAPDILVPGSQAGQLPILLQSISPILEVSPLMLSFAAAQGGTVPAAAQLSIENSGGGAEAWTATSSQSWLTLSQGSGTAPAAVNVAVDPSGLGPGAYNGTISVTANGAPNSPQGIVVTLTVSAAHVVAASLGFSPSTLTGPGTTTGTVTLSAAAPAGGVAVALSSDNSAVQIPSSVTVAGGSTSGTFSATGTGVATQTSVTVTASLGGVSTTAVLTLIPGVATATLSTTNLSFGPQALGTTSAVQSVTLANTGSVSLSIAGVAVTGPNGSDFSQTNDCGVTVAAGSACTLAVTFKPGAAGNRMAILSVTDALGTQSVALSGSGVAASRSLQVSPSSLPYGIQRVGTASSSQMVRATNTGNVALALTSISVTGTNRGEFTETNNCGTTLAVGATCTMTVRFTPAGPGPRSASVALRDGAGTQIVSLSGTGLAPLSLSVKTLSFGNQALGSSGAAKTVTLTNNTGVPVDIAGISTTGADPSDFVQTATTCGAALAWKAACTVTQRFAPAALGSRNAALTIVDDAENSPQVVALTGTGVIPVAVSPASLTFTTRNVNTTSAAKIVTIKNNLPTALTIASVAVAGSNANDFRESATTCGATLATAASCTISITFTPSANGARSATLDISDGAVNSPQTVSLSGTGKGAVTGSN